MDEAEQEAADLAACVAKVQAIADFEAAMVSVLGMMEKARDAASQRQALVMALAAVNQLMRGCEISLRLQSPFVALAGALDALDTGAAVPAFLTPAKRERRGAPVAAEPTLVGRALAAAAVEIRMEELGGGGGSLDEAATWVARKTADWDIWPARRDLNPVEALKGWRLEALGGSSKSLSGKMFSAYTTMRPRLSAQEVIEKEASVYGVFGAKAPRAS